MDVWLMHGKGFGVTLFFLIYKFNAPLNCTCAYMNVCKIWIIPVVSEREGKHSMMIKFYATKALLIKL